MPERNLRKRFTQFGIDVVRFSRSLSNDPALWNTKRQLRRSATSVGANYREAQSARTKAEFTSKVQIALQEASESVHRMETLLGTLTVRTDDADRLSREAVEIFAILSAIVKTAKSRPKYRG